ncbi:hypothetical protein Ndes2437B_g07068 [Nannochloris sp. 'desiccata']
MASGAANLQGSIPNQFQNDIQVDEQAPKPKNDVAMDHQDNADFNALAEQEPHLTAEAPMSLPLNGGFHPSAGTQERTTAAMNAPILHQNNPNYSPYASQLEQHTDTSSLSPFQMAPPPSSGIPNFSKPPQVAGQYSQPRNSSLDSAASQSRRHHLLRHTLPFEAVGANAVHHFGVTNVPDALRAVQKMSQRDLQQAFERVYNVKSSSNNNNWLRKKLVEALVPKDGPSSGDAAINAILDEIMIKGPSAKKRAKETADGTTTGDGSVDGRVPPPYPQQKQRKQSVVRPSPLDTYPGYHEPEEYLPGYVEDTGLTAGGRRKRRAAAGVAAATAAVLRDPDLEEIEKADLQRASSGEQDRRYGTGNSAATAAAVTAAARGGRQVSAAGDNNAVRFNNREGGGGGGQHHPSTGSRVEEQSQDAIANALQTLTHLLSIAVRQGKVNPGGSSNGGIAGALGAFGGGASAANGWGDHQYLQSLQQQQQQQHYYQQQQQAAAAAFARPLPPQAQAADPYAMLQQYAAANGMRGQGATTTVAAPTNAGGAPDTRAQLVEALSAAGIFGKFGGQRAQHQQAQAQAPPTQQPPSITAAAAAAAAVSKQRGGGGGGGQQDSAALDRLLASLGQQQQAVAPAAVVAPPVTRPINPANPSASELLHRALAAHAAAHQQRINPQQPPAAAAAPAPTPTAPINGSAPSAPVPYNIPGSNFPMDHILMQLLQQQAGAQKPAAGNQPGAGAAAPPAAAGEGAAQQ